MGSMVYQVECALKEQLRIGESRHAAKIREDTRAPEGIFSYGTLATYIKQACGFVNWARAGHRCNTLEKARPYVEAYLQQGIDRGLSASTLSTQRAALCKLYRCHAEDLNITLPERRRADIERSRGNAARDYGFSVEKNADVVAFARATGLRRHELEALRPSQIQMGADGRLRLVDVVGKNGKIRNIEVLSGSYAAVLKFADLPYDKRIFGKVHSHMDVHGYRREYTQAFYEKIARPLDSLSREEKYYCKNDKRGTVYDRRAMLHVSRQLGHNRISVIAGNYLG